MSKVAIVDYGVGNILSLQRALEACETDVVLAATPAELEAAGRLILPGVGAFSHAVGELRRQGLEEPILRHVERARPLLGICVGMQMLLEYSTEFGHSSGLGLIKGGVNRIRQDRPDGGARRIPHIGWSQISPAGANSWDATPLAGTEPGTAMYFVHSYTAQCDYAGDCMATVDYDGEVVTAFVASECVFGAQFHPEKSGPAGLSIMRRFLDC